ncbi:MAG: PEP/pyruvate-binding domain-containing protein [Alloprevotella sp.]|nr:PEP/pyruvate-binding domain-containing protein [Alloprevotella sp.]
MTPSLNELVLRDTPYAALMNKRIFNVLLIATKYDAFMLEDDGRVDEQIFNEYTALNLRYPPRFTQVTTEEEALCCLQDRNFELVIVMPNMAGRDIFAAAGSIKALYPHIPIVVLTPFSKEVSRRVAGEDLSHIDYVFSWLGNSELLLAIIKLIEDKLNAPDDLPSVGVQTILLVEDSIRFYSSALPHLYRVVLEQSREFSKEALNDHLKMLRMRGRPKIMLARTYEEAVDILHTYPDNILGVVSDMSFSREGQKDPLAGYRLGQELRRINRHIPLILESSEVENEQYARKLGASFIPKRSKSYPQDLQAQIMQHFGFGDFIIDDPDTHQELLRIKDLKDLQKKIFQIPDNALRYHLSHNHFSRFFYSRAMFPPAEILKAHDANQYTNMDEARQFIFNIIVRYRKMKNAGVVAIYQKERFDEYSNFARIGNGSLGGKGRGLAFMGTLVKRYPTLVTDNFHVDIPKTVVICTDIFDQFMEQNNLYPIALSDAPDEEILQAFEQATLPHSLLEDLISLFKVSKNPLAVRSSSILEDSHYQPFAGIYATYMIPRIDDEQTSMRLVRAAIKAVYASVFYRDSKAYLTATQNLIDQEKMAVVLQEVVGEPHGQVFYPTLSGVARSLNFYPIGDEKPEEGIANIAVGLGKYIVDGGQALRFSPAHPKHILQLGSTETALRETQRDFLALDLQNLSDHFQTDDAFNLCRLPLSALPPDDTAARYVISTYDLQNGRLNPGTYCNGPGRRLATFSGILQSDAFPLADTIKRLLEIGAAEMGRPVEIEFAMQITGGKAWFYLLQIRPIVDRLEEVAPDFDAQTAGRLLLGSTSVLGNGQVVDVQDVVYVRSEHFNPAHSKDIARELDLLNERLQNEEKGYVLVGPGRWGSSDPWLGIPVKWPQISGARIIVECGLSAYRIDPSQGTHFFQNLTSLGVGYFTIRPYADDGSFDEDWLNEQPAVYESHFLRQVHFSAPLCIQMDGRHGRGGVWYPAGAEA